MSKYIVLHGIKIAKEFTPETFGRLTSIGPVFRVRTCSRHVSHAVFECECGNFLLCEVSRVRSGNVRSCGCLRKETMDRNRRLPKRGFSLVNGIRIQDSFTPEVNGMLTSVGPQFMLPRKSKNGGTERLSHAVYVCQCGAFTVCNVTSVKIGHKRSCGCLHKETASNLSMSRAKHGHCINNNHRLSPEYRAWEGMKRRVLNRNDVGYSNYGGRGIMICERWLDHENGFVNFLSDMGHRPTELYSLDRIDVNGNYEKNNCRWATVEEQSNNKRTTRYLTAFGKTQSFAMWSRESGIKKSTLYNRIKSGMSCEDALKMPYNC